MDKALRNSLWGGLGSSGRTLPPAYTDLLAWYRTQITGGRLQAYRPLGSSTPQVKGSLFTGAGTGACTGLLTTDTITSSGTPPTCTVDGTLTISADCWDIEVHRAGVLWASWKGINVGQDTELDASGNGHHLVLTTTTIAEADDGTGTNYRNETGHIHRDYPYQYIIGDGTGYLANAELVGTETVVSKNGTAAVTLASERVNVGIGTLWSFVLSNGSTYEHGTVTGLASAICYDTSGNGRHLAMTGFADVIAACSSGVEFGSDVLNQEGWSEYENLLSAYPSTSGQIDVTPDARDNFYALTKKDTGSYRSSLFAINTLRPTYQKAAISAKATFRKLPGVPGVVDLGWYDTSFNNHTVSILSGPGTASLSAGCPHIVDLSETEDTIVVVSKSNMPVGGAATTLLVYPGGLASTTIGHGCIIGNVQISESLTPRDFTSKLNIPYGIQPRSVRGHDSTGYRFACAGDSITYGFAPYLKILLPSSVGINAGVGGNTTALLLARLDADVLSKSPHYCTLLIGINDINTDVAIGTIFGNITTMAGQIVTAGIVPILSTILPYGGNGNWTAGRQEVLIALNDLIRSYCTAQGVVCVDAYNSDLRADEGVSLKTIYSSGDGLHLNVLGYRYLAGLFDAAIPTVFTPGDVCGNSLKWNPETEAGPLNVSATITAGTVYPDITIKAPLGPEFQAIT